MDIKIKGFDYKNNEIALPEILWYKRYIGLYGVHESYTFGFCENVPMRFCKVLISTPTRQDEEFFVDIIEYEQNKDGAFFSIKVKNILCRLFEHQVFPATHDNFTVKNMLDLYAKGHNIKNIVPDMDQYTIDKFFVDMGMTAWDIIHLFYEKAHNKDIFLDNKKQLTFSYSPTPKIYFGTQIKDDKYIDGIDYIKVKRIDDRSNIISKAYVRVINEKDNVTFSQLKSENQYAKTCNILRDRYYNIPKQLEILPKNGSDYIVGQKNKKRFKYEIVTLQPVELHPGMIIDINKLTDQLCVMEIFQDCTQEGIKTKIICRDTLLK